MVRALTRRWRSDAADAFLVEMRDRVEALRATLTDPERTAVVLVTRPDAVVVAETLRYADALERLSMRVAAVVTNAVPRDASPAVSSALRTLEGMAAGAIRLEVPAVSDAPNGLADIEALFTGSAAAPRKPPRPVPVRASSPPSYVIAPAMHPLTIVAGKGGVGKTTVACAMAVALARPEAPILVVSSDPAPSVADALDQPVPDADVAVEGAPGCFARQMDASAAFERFRETYAERVDIVFDRLTAGSLNLAHDRAVMRDLLALAPPGIDELYALVTLGELLTEGRYASIIVDPAPTGHLLRLLEMPSLALSWSHRLMRIMLEYKEVAGLGDAARDLLDFARRTRALRELMGDSSKTTALLVSNDEPLVRSETTRLLHACRERGVEVGAIIWNRAEGDVAPLSDPDPGAQFEAPATAPAPRGATALRAWCASWRPLDERPRA